jgi:hypothetical protein
LTGRARPRSVITHHPVASVSFSKETQRSRGRPIRRRLCLAAAGGELVHDHLLIAFEPRPTAATALGGDAGLRLGVPWPAAVTGRRRPVRRGASRRPSLPRSTRDLRDLPLRRAWCRCTATAGHADRRERRRAACPGGWCTRPTGNTPSADARRPASSTAGGMSTPRSAPTRGARSPRAAAARRRGPGSGRWTAEVLAEVGPECSRRADGQRAGGLAGVRQGVALLLQRHTDLPGTFLEHLRRWKPVGSARAGQVLLRFLCCRLWRRCSVR